MRAKNKTVGDLIETLTLHIDLGEITVKQLAHWGVLSAPTIYSYLARQTERGPHAETLRAWLSAMPRSVRLSVAQSFLAGTGLEVRLADTDADTDLNGDGKTDCLDAIGGAVRITGDAQDLLAEVSQAVQDGRISDRELAAVIDRAARLQDSAQHGLRVMAAAKKRVG